MEITTLCAPPGHRTTTCTATACTAELSSPMIMKRLTGYYPTVMYNCKYIKWPYGGPTVIVLWGFPLLHPIRV